MVIEVLELYSKNGSNTALWKNTTRDGMKSREFIDRNSTAWDNIRILNLQLSLNLNYCFL